MSSQSQNVPPAVFEHRDEQSGYVKQYKCGKALGHGGFATVFKCQSVDSGRIYACKVIDKRTLKKKPLKERLITEIKLHRTLSHANIIRFERFFEDKQWVYIILEICTNGSMMDIMNRRKRLTQPESAFYFKQIVIAVKYLHSQKILHRDLKLG
jgi:serine/threonine protein kinase